MKDPNCGYCVHGEPLAAFGIYICDLSVSSLYLFKEQSHPGRCIVAYKDHISEIVNISDEDRNAFFADVNRAAKAIHAATGESPSAEHFPSKALWLKENCPDRWQAAEVLCEYQD